MSSDPPRDGASEEPAAEVFELQAPEAQEASRRTSWFGPLFLIPLGLVGTALALYLFMTWIMSDRAGPEEHLQELVQDVVGGGYNQRKQSMYSLMISIQAYKEDGRLGELPPDFDDEVAAAFDLTEPDQSFARVALTTTLTELESELAFERVVKMVRDARTHGGIQPETPLESLGVVEFAHLDPLSRGLLMLGQIGDPRGVPVLGEFLDSDDPGLRMSSAAALGAIDSPEILPLLRKALGDGDPDTRRNAAVSLARHGDPAGQEVLIDMLNIDGYGGYRDPDMRTRAVVEALRGLHALRVEAAAGAVERLSEDDGATPQERSAALAWLRDQRAGWPAGDG